MPKKSRLTVGDRQTDDISINRVSSQLKEREKERERVILEYGSLIQLNPTICLNNQGWG